MTFETTDDTFHALVLEESDGKVTPHFKTLANDTLPDGDVTVAVTHSSLNYKDGMILAGIGRLVRNYPHVPGIDFVGRVENSNSPDFKPGDWVVLTGWRVGEMHWGGYATRARVRSEWLVPLASGLSPENAMAVGTAGLTAMLAVMALEDHGLKPTGEGEVLVTGAAGGVGSIAVAILAKLGYRVAAGTGRAQTADALQALGASRIVSRETLQTPPKGPLGSEQWSGVIDNVGGPILANALAGLRYGGGCAAVGLAASSELATTVLPFILRGVALLGIDSVMCPKTRREAAWKRLVTDLPLDDLAKITQVVPLSGAPELGRDILAGKVQGRVVFDVHS